MEKKYWIVGLFAIAFLVSGFLPTIAEGEIRKSEARTIQINIGSESHTIQLAVGLTERLIKAFPDRYSSELQTYPERDCQKETFNQRVCETDSRKVRFAETQINNYLFEIEKAKVKEEAEEAARANADTSITIN